MKFKGFAYIYTIGCQMNVYDSAKLLSVLKSIGYEETEVLEKADIVVCNTCTIRNKAQEKAYSFLGRLSKLKKSKPHLISVIAGCVAQQDGAKALKRLSEIDIVLGTQSFSRFAELVEQVKKGKTNIVDIEERQAIFEVMPDASNVRQNEISKFVTIMQGCENFCTYCVVPYVRGKEKSRSPEAIIQEIEQLCEYGIKEVTLLGQNVNSYGIKEGDISFAKLLKKVNSIDSIQRIRFATSHPKDLSNELIYAIRDLEKVCLHLHLPVQSGSDRILKRMNRGYTQKSYLEKITKLKKECPGIAISTDLITGFPSETRDEFQETLNLMKKVEFDSVFAFSYSDRPIAPAMKFDGKINEEEKLSRLNELFELQKIYTEKNNKKLIGKIESVLVEGKSKKKMKQADESKDNIEFIKNKTQMMGRTESNKIVHFQKNNIEPGMLVDVRIEQAYPHSLWGTVEQDKELLKV
ncbi:MAG: tRNA (N6-isopentenyl adenosine(37)-C2)-methylthiotransferase MiaB [Desulfobacteraceae bacterium]|nr:tRNA (N6-isopentenyl adenosine(37)-C2)-methylthiotransferase MiaB [Desulfobacteraceae bacterium]